MDDATAQNKRAAEPLEDVFSGNDYSFSEDSDADTDL
jgi:hypothetical protein